MRFCVDYRALNGVTTKVAYPMPRIDEMLDNLGGSNLTAEARAKSAFRTRSGLYEFRVMPFGLTNAPATFQRLMNVVLAGLMPLHCMVYIDDVVIFSKGTFEEHLGWVDKVLTCIEEAGLQINLGHIVGQSGVRPDPGKVIAVNDIQPPI